MLKFVREGAVAERPHLNLPPETFEEELGLDGFFGPVSHLYHRHPPTQWKDIRLSPFQWEKPTAEPTEFLRPQCYEKIASKPSGDFFESGHLLFWNEDIAIWVHNPHRSNEIYFRNADASELYFCHEGELQCDSVFGSLTVRAGDYVVIPKGVTYRWHIQSPSYLLRMESFQESLKEPPKGILGQQALYHEQGMETPIFDSQRATERESLVRVQSGKSLTDVKYPFDIRALSGWMGTLYPWKLSVKNIAPVMSSVAHLPPSINSTFVTKNFVVCSFLPRPLEEPPGALRVPFYHSNIDYDEVIFYHAGDFFSRDRMGPGFVTLHPRGINHGPHPKALQNQNKITRTNEIAVMIDTVRPLHTSSIARGLELEDYWKSWMPQ